MLQWLATIRSTNSSPFPCPASTNCNTDTSSYKTLSTLYMASHESNKAATHIWKGDRDADFLQAQAMYLCVATGTDLTSSDGLIVWSGA
jgi:hypothetical protein